jgi:hypothetical protein
MIKTSVLVVFFVPKGMKRIALLRMAVQDGVGERGRHARVFIFNLEQ